MARSTRNGFFALVGIGLVIAGSILLADRLIAPILAPLQGVLHALGLVAWPLALIGVGIVLITASRHPESGSKLYRSRTDRVLAGVLGGFAERWGASSTLVRIVFVVLAILTSGVFAVILYVLAAAFIPEQQAAFGDTAATPAPPAPPVPPAPPIPTPAVSVTPEPPAAPESFSAPVVS